MRCCGPDIKFIVAVKLRFETRHSTVEIEKTNDVTCDLVRRKGVVDVDGFRAWIKNVSISYQGNSIFISYYFPSSPSSVYPHSIKSVCKRRARVNGKMPKPVQPSLIIVFDKEILLLMVIQKYDFGGCCVTVTLLRRFIVVVLLINTLNLSFKYEFKFHDYRCDLFGN